MLEDYRMLDIKMLLLLSITRGNFDNFLHHDLH